MTRVHRLQRHAVGTAIPGGVGHQVFDGVQYLLENTSLNESRLKHVGYGCVGCVDKDWTLE